MRTVTISVSSVFPATAETIWPLLLRVETLRYVAAPYASFTAIGDVVQWRKGMTAEFRLRIFGLPFGVHTIRVKRLESKKFIVQTAEGNSAVPIWNHKITMTPQGDSTRYTDEVTLGARHFTPAVAIWSRAFYRHRQKKWRRLLKGAVAQ
jgi:ligand-binding SRPBCC domain-containing protein